MAEIESPIAGLPGDATLSPGMMASRVSLRTALELTKLRIVILSTLSAATGYVAFSHRVDAGLMTACLGVLLLAAGACALNQFQDRDIDGQMERTRRRPLPRGAVKPSAALALSVLLLLGGFLLLWLGPNLAAALIGLLAVVGYNGIYTYVKRHWAFAVIPGALIGALPPVIGWTAAGGRPAAPQLFALSFFLFIWQVPHFWLLLLVSAGDYEKAGLPSLTRLFSMRQLASLTGIWIWVACVSSLLLPIYRLTSSSWASLSLVAGAVWVAWKDARLFRESSEALWRRSAFRLLNLYALVVMALVAADALL